MCGSGKNDKALIKSLPPTLTSQLLYSMTASEKDSPKKKGVMIFHQSKILFKPKINWRENCKIPIKEVKIVPKIRDFHNLSTFRLFWWKRLTKTRKITEKETRKIIFLIVQVKTGE